MHFELLSETGLFDFCFYSIDALFFLFLVKSYLLSRNIYQLSGMLFILTTLIPYLPSKFLLKFQFSYILDELCNYGWFY